MNARDLFGGNMTALLPVGATDVSDMRQVPDNQEVFVHDTSDQSIMVELLSFVDQPDEEALRTHFEDIATSNDATGADDNRIVSVQSIPTNTLSTIECTSAYYLLGQQAVSKFNESARNLVNIHLGLLRLQNHSTDVVVTLNDPVQISHQSSSAAGLALGDGLDILAAQGNGAEPNRWTVEQFQQCLQSLRLVNPQFLN